MTSSGERDFTENLQRAVAGDQAAAELLLEAVYERLRGIARHQLAGERKDHTLSPTALIHEAYLRLVGDGSMEQQGRAQFFHAAAEAMRRILIEHARARGRQKRGGGRRRLPMSVLDLVTCEDPEEIMTLDRALCRLEGVDARSAEVIRLRFYAGLSEDEAANALGVARSTVQRDWRFARAWLFQALEEEGGAVDA